MNAATQALVLKLRRRGVAVAGETPGADLPKLPPSTEASLVVPSDGPSTTTVADLTERVAQLERALSRRGHIGQAQGVLMERHGISADAAFRVLVTVSNNTNRKLHDVAAELARTRAPLPPPTTRRGGLLPTPGRTSRSRSRTTDSDGYP